MELRITLIRSGNTEKENSIIGVTNLPLSPQGERLLEKRAACGIYPDVDLVFTSDLLRTRQTAGVIYPRVPAVLTKGLRAFDYGNFEGQEYSSVLKEEVFAHWARSPGLSEYPGGESPHIFQVRCAKTFREIVMEIYSKKLASAAVITHKLVINSILQRYSTPKSHYHHLEMGTGGGCICLVNPYDCAIKVEKVF